MTIQVKSFLDQTNFNKKETAQLLNGFKYIMELATKGILKTIRAGGRVYYKFSDIEKALIQL